MYPRTFRCLETPNRSDLDGKATIIVISKKCGTKPCPNHALQTGTIAKVDEETVSDGQTVSDALDGLRRYTGSHGQGGLPRT